MFAEFFTEEVGKRYRMAIGASCGPGRGLDSVRHCSTSDRAKTHAQSN